MPKPILGGATLIMFSMIATYGIKIITLEQIDRRAMIIMGMSFAFGFGVTFQSDVLSGFPPIIQNIFSSGMTTGGLVAIFLNLVIPK